MSIGWMGIAAAVVAVSASQSSVAAAGQIMSPTDQSPRVAQRVAVLSASAASALFKGEAAKAAGFAEAAVRLAPRDARGRLLLGRSYLALGRFRSADGAFADALRLDPALTRAAVSRVLTRIALGDADGARTLVAAITGSVPDADVGLALALMGDGAAALQRLDLAARAAGADARVRQNLGLAYALQGRWVDAVAVAQQDVPPDQMPGRLRRWAMIAQLRGDPAMQVGAILGVLPAADDGQPSELALSAEKAPAVSVAQAPESEVVAAVGPVTAVRVQDEGGSIVTATALSPPPLEQLVAAQPSVPAAVMHALPATPSQAASSAPAGRGLSSAPGAGRSRAAVGPATSTAKPLLRLIGHAVASAAAPSVSWAVQLGAYSSVRIRDAAWRRLRGTMQFLAAYQPAAAAWRSRRAMVYRLSIGDLPSRKVAAGLCMRVRSAGGDCFVRGIRGDVPMRWAAVGKQRDAA